MSDDFTSLVTSMVNLRKQGNKPYVLVLGSGDAPLQFDDVVRAVLKFDMDEEEIRKVRADTSAELLEKKWRALGPDERSTCLRNALADVDRKAWMDSYRGLGRLVRHGYFNLILTTHVDRYLENALIAAGLGYDDFEVFILGKSGPDAIREGLAHDFPRIKIVKLCGDVQSRSFAVTDDELDENGAAAKDIISDCLAQRAILVGYGDRDDAALTANMPASGGVMYYVNEHRPGRGTTIYKSRAGAGKSIIGPSAAFGAFFGKLAEKVLGVDALEEMGVHLSDENVATVVRSEKLVVEMLGDLEIQGSTSTLVEEPEAVIVQVTYDEDQKLTFGLSGALKYTSKESVVLRLDTAGLSANLSYMGRDLRAYYELHDKTGRSSWRARAKWEGERLYRDMFATNADLLQRFGMAAGRAQSCEDLVLAFAGPRTHIGMPYELLYQDTPWAIKYPICRQVLGVQASGSSFRDVLDALDRTGRQKGQRGSLRVLLVASDTGGGIDPDGEIEAIAAAIRGKRKSVDIPVDVELLPTKDASIHRLRELLVDDAYHVIHYAGHADFTKDKPEDSHLLVWGGVNSTGDRERLTAREIATLIRRRKTPPALFVLNACVGAEIGGAHLLHQGTYLGLIDALVMSGIPTVMGYRWYVTDVGARRFAVHFYEELLSTRRPAVAALRARSDVFCADGDDETWMSPILVDQNP